MDKFMKALDFDSDTLGNAKRDVNFVLQRLIGNMVEKGSTNGMQEKFVPVKTVRCTMAKENFWLL